MYIFVETLNLIYSNFILYYIDQKYKSKTRNTS